MAYKDRDPNPKVDTFTPQTLKGPKTLVSPVLTTPQINDTSADHQYIVAVSELAADRTITLPLLTGNDEVVFKDHTQTLTGKSIDVSQLTGSITPARIPTLFTVVTTTLTGTQNNFDPGIVGNTHILCNGASNITITGLAAGTEGQMVMITGKNGSQQVILPHENAGSTVANRLQNIVTSGNTVIAAPTVSRGHALYVYEDARWRLKSFEQGGWITPAFAAGDYTANGAMTWTVDATDVTTQAYLLSGRTLTVMMSVTSTSVGGTLNTQLFIGNGAWGGFTSTRAMFQAAHILDNAVRSTGLLQASASGTNLTLFKVDLSNWSAATNATGVQGSITFEVT